MHFPENQIECLTQRDEYSKECPLTDYLTEQEQVQLIKNWLKQYGLTIIVGIILAFSVTTGWRYWQNYKNKILTHASAIYDEMLTLRAQGNAAETAVQANKLLSHYPKTPYAQMAAFMLAREAVLKKNYDEANKQLNWVMDHTKDNSIHQIARLRIARILITEKKPDAAIDLLKTVDDANFNGLIDEVRGDAFLAMNNTASAKQAYQQALSELPNAEEIRPILQMKIDNLATS